MIEPDLRLFSFLCGSEPFAAIKHCWLGCHTSPGKLGMPVRHVAVNGHKKPLQASKGYLAG